ncbi:hypothetical protein ACLKA7_016276 [Drosophila subpalustris]
MSVAQQQETTTATRLPSMDCQSENRVPENSIRNVAKTQTSSSSSSLTKPQSADLAATKTNTKVTTAVATSALTVAKQQPQTQYVINSAPMHAKATTAGIISGGTLHLHRVKSAQPSRHEVLAGKDIVRGKTKASTEMVDVYT